MTLPAPPPEKGTRIVFGGAPGMSSQGESRGVPRELRTSCPHSSTAGAFSTACPSG